MSYAIMRTIYNTYYYRYVTSTFVQPTVTSNTDSQMISGWYNETAKQSTMSGAAYNAFLPNTGTLYFYRNEKPSYGYIYFTFPYELCIKSFTFKCNSSGDASSHAYEPTIYGGNYIAPTSTVLGTGSTVNIGKTGTIDMSSNTSFYKNFTFKVRNGGGATNDALKVTNFSITGTKRELVSSTASNYDVAITVPTTYVYNKFKS